MGPKKVGRDYRLFRKMVDPHCVRDRGAIVALTNDRLGLVYFGFRVDKARYGYRPVERKKKVHITWN